VVRKTVVPILAALLSGCGLQMSDTRSAQIEKLTPFNQGYQALFALDVATLIVTDKLMVDHIVSFVRQEDCSAVRASQGDTYCRPFRLAYTPPPEPFCYRTLAAVSCYAQPNPFGSDQRMGSYLPGITRIR
jgi:hypothetical protein